MSTLKFGDFASFVTLLMFVVLIYGKTKTTRSVAKRRFDSLEVLNISDDEVEQYRDLDNFIDLGGGQLIKLKAQVKIDSVKIYDIEYYDHSGEESKYISNLRISTESVEPQDCLYLYLELGECMPMFSVEINYVDHSIATFLLSENRRNGSVEKESYTVKVGIKTFLHYLFA